MNSVVIITNKMDFCVNEVVEHIALLDYNTVVFSSDDLLKKQLTISLEGTKEDLALNLFGIEKVHSIWFRRSFMKDDFTLDRYISGLEYQLNKSVINENEKYLNYIFNLLEVNFKTLGSFLMNSQLSKLDVLNTCIKIGIQIPKSYITNNKVQLSKILSIEKKLITKCINESFRFKNNSGYYMNFTERIIIDDLSQYKDTFGISMFQKEINKKMDIRSIYFNGTIDSIAELSQNKSPDIRLERNQHETFKFSFDLPQKYEELLIKLMVDYQIEFACIDSCISQTDEIYFLEINPGGVFSDSSTIFGFEIQKKIAQYLCQEIK